MNVSGDARRAAPGGLDHHHLGGGDVEGATGVGEVGRVLESDVEVEVAAADRHVRGAVVVPEDDERARGDGRPEWVDCELVLASAVVRHVRREVLEDHPAHVE